MGERLYVTGGTHGIYIYKEPPQPSLLRQHLQEITTPECKYYLNCYRKVPPLRGNAFFFLSFLPSSLSFLQLCGRATTTPVVEINSWNRGGGPPRPPFEKQPPAKKNHPPPRPPTEIAQKRWLGGNETVRIIIIITTVSIKWINSSWEKNFTFFPLYLFKLIIIILSRREYNFMIGKRWYSSLENSFQMILHRKEEERARLKCITQVWKREVSYQGKGKNFSSFVRSTALWTEWIEVLGRGFGRRKVALTFKVSRLSSSLSMQIAGNVGS